VVPPDGGVLDGPVYPLDLTVRPWVPRLGQAVLYVALGAGKLKRVGAEELLASEHLLDLVGRSGVAAGLGEGRAVIDENRVNLVGNGRDQGA
jgi:hypothetical protein